MDTKQQNQTKSSISNTHPHTKNSTQTNSTQQTTQAQTTTTTIINDEEIVINISNLKENIARGHLHDELENTEDKFRVYYQNANGIKKKGKWLAWSVANQWFKQNQFDYFSLVETNLRWTSDQLNQCKQTTTKIHKKNSISHSSSLLESLSSYQPGGTVSVVTNKWTSRSASIIQDPSGLGRWSGHELRCKGHNSLSMRNNIN